MSPIPSIWVAHTPRVLADNRSGMIELPSSIRHRNIWAYLALTLVILVISFLLAYLVYSCYAVSNRTPIASGTPTDPKPRKDFLNERKEPNHCRSDSQRMMMSNTSQASVIEPTCVHDHYSVSMPPLAVTTTSPLNYGRPIDKPVDYSSHSHETPLGLDSHNIRYVPPITSCSPPAVVMIWNDPKLSPIHGSIVMSTFYDDSDNTTILAAQPQPTRGRHARKDLP